MARPGVPRAAGTRMIRPAAPDPYHAAAGRRSVVQRSRNAAMARDGGMCDVGG